MKLYYGKNENINLHFKAYFDVFTPFSVLCCNNNCLKTRSIVDTINCKSIITPKVLFLDFYI